MKLEDFRIYTNSNSNKVEHIFIDFSHDKKLYAIPVTMRDLLNTFLDKEQTEKNRHWIEYKTGGVR